MKNFKELLRKPAFYRRIAMALMVVLIVARPHFSTESAERELSNLNVWFVADATGSMIARDADSGNTRRFEKVQNDLEEIVSNIPGAKYAAIVQDYSSYTASPISSNADAVLAAKAYLKPKGTVWAKPTDLSDLLSYASKVIEKYQQRHPERVNVIVIMSDGEDVSKNEVSIPSELAKLLDGGAVLGYGSTRGSIIEEVGTIYDDVYIKDRYVTYYSYGKDSDIEVDSSNRVISKIDENNLRKIASAIHINYYHRESGAVPARIIDEFSRIAMSKPTESTDENANVGAEIYWVFAIVLLFLLLWESEDTLARLLSEREMGHA